MLEGFDFVTSVANSFKTAHEFFKKGSEKFSETKSFKDIEEESSFMVKKHFQFDSALRSARANMQQMLPPVGMAPPNIQAAYRHFADNTARDRTLQSIRAENYRASRTSKIASTKPTMNVGYQGNVDIGSARQSRVKRTTFRSRLG